jgi:hypothetical protein
VGEVVKVSKYGVSFKVPKGWISLDSSDVGKADSPIVRTVAHRLGVTPQQVIASFQKSLLSISVTDHGAVNGVLDNINSVGTGNHLPTDNGITLQLAQIGARPGSIHHIDTRVGKGVRVAYRWTTNGLHFHGEIVAVDTGPAVLSITVTAHAAPTAKSLADGVQASLDRL